MSHGPETSTEAEEEAEERPAQMTNNYNSLMVQQHAAHEYERRMIEERIARAREDGIRDGRFMERAEQARKALAAPAPERIEITLLRSMLMSLERIEQLLKDRPMTGHKTKLPNARVKDGKLEIDKPRAKLPPHVKAAKANKRKWRAAK